MKIKSIKSKKAQEEMVGFAMIIVIVVIALMFLLFLFLRGGERTVQSEEVGNFLQSLLYYTTDCKDARGNLSVQSLMIDCVRDSEDTCEGTGKKVCEELNSTISDVLNETWDIELDPNIEGYHLEIFSLDDEGLRTHLEINGEDFSISKGNDTLSMRTASRTYSSRGERMEISLRLYYPVE